MKCFIALGLLLCVSCEMSAQAQTSTDDYEGVRLTAGATTDTKVLTWWGRAGRTYFVQQSYDLVNWIYVPTVRDGADAVDGVNFTVTDSRQFWRLTYTDASTGGLSGANADFDLDGISNIDELGDSTNVFNADTDNDGFGDGVEALAGTDAKGAASNPATVLNDVPQLQTALALDTDGHTYYMASSNVYQFDPPDFWAIHEYSTIPGNSYYIFDTEEGAMPELPALPAMFTAGSSTDTWGSYTYAGTAQSVSLVRIVNGDYSSPTATAHVSWLTGNAVKYKFTVQYPSLNARTIKVLEQKTRQPVAYDPATEGYDYAGALTVTDTVVHTLTLPANATETVETAETILQPDEAADNTETTATIGKALFITPGGDPVTGPVDAGPTPATPPGGANEFTFSNATAGVLTLALKVRLPGVVDQSATDQAKYTFQVDAIGASVLSWGPDNTGGKAKVDGEYLTATAIFTGLPQNNTDFGRKTVRLMYDGNEVAEQAFEVFFMRDETNHPGAGAGNDPNWFYYWRQAAGAGSVNLVYDGAGPDGATYGETIGMTQWSWAQKPDKTMIKFYDPVRLTDREYSTLSADDARTGIDAFFTALLHEQQHVQQITNADALLGNLVAPNTPWQFGWSWNTDKTFGLNSNHYTLGTDGKPGVAGADDDRDTTVDNLITTGRGELGILLAQLINPPAGLVETDDVALEVGGTHGIDWPTAWPVPANPAGCTSPLYIEWDAINAAKAHAQDQNAADDWANPGKQHKTKKYDD